MSICLNITHAAQYVERRAVMQRLRESINAPSLLIPYNEVTHVGPHWEWAEMGWDWARRQATSHALFLQDDVIPHPKLVEIVTAMTKAMPEHILSLHSPHPGATRHCLDADLPWYSTSDCMIGTAYVLPKFLLEEFFEWRANALLDVRSMNEDNQVALFAMATGRHLFHPVPAPVDHDLTVATTWEGGDAPGTSQFKRPMLPWWTMREKHRAKFEKVDLTSPDFWRPSRPIPHVGRMRRGNHWHLITHLKSPLPIRAYSLHNDTTIQAPKS
jgi:hypothetical protein